MHGPATPEDVVVSARTIRKALALAALGIAPKREYREYAEKTATAIAAESEYAEKKTKALAAAQQAATDAKNPEQAAQKAQEAEQAAQAAGDAAEEAKLAAETARQAAAEAWESQALENWGVIAAPPAPEVPRKVSGVL